MKRREFVLSGLTLGASALLSPGDLAAAQANVGAAELYPLGPDSKPQPGVPAGKIFNFTLRSASIFAGTERTIQVYIPAQYKAEKPACLWLRLDGLTQTTATVLDNLGHRGETPLMIAVGLQPGTTTAATTGANGAADPRYNRSFEFDSLTNTLGRFIAEELLPELEKRQTPEGLPIKLSDDPNDCGVSGGSTGGIGAFKLAFNNPHLFRRVFSCIGTFVGMRGGDTFPVLVRKTEPKPLRVFLQDGDKDGWPGGLEFGDWWMSNQEMERALTFAGYEVDHAWGMLGHNQQQAEAILPDVLRWLWKDWPKPVQAGQSKNSVLQTTLVPGEQWERVPVALDPSPTSQPPTSVYACPPSVDDTSTVASMASDAQGNLYIQSPATGRIHGVKESGDSRIFATLSPGNHAIACGPDGRLYVAETSKTRIVSLSRDGSVKAVAENITAHQLVVTHDERIYVTQPNPYGKGGQISLLRPDGSRTVVAENPTEFAALAFSPDGLWLFAADSLGHHGYSYRVKPNGELEFGEPLYWFHLPDSANDSGCNQLCMDRRGTAYAATRMGVQLFDRNGRVRAIIPLDGQQLTGICFGGPDLNMLYVTTGTEVYRRKVQAVGVPPWANPIAEPPVGSG